LVASSNLSKNGGAEIYLKGLMEQLEELSKNCKIDVITVA